MDAKEDSNNKVPTGAASTPELKVAEQVEPGPVPVLSKKDKYRQYLLTSGFKYAFTRAIVALYEDPEKPDDPLVWIMGFMGYGIPKLENITSCREEAKALHIKIDALQEQNVYLRSKIEKWEEKTAQEQFMKQFEWTSKLHLNEAGDEEEEEDA